MNTEVNSVFLTAIKKADFGTINDLIKLVDLDEQYGPKKKTYLHYAVKYQNLELLRLLAERGAAIDAEDAERNTPLHLAAKRGNLQIIKYLITKGANVNAKNYWGQTVLHLAVESSRKRVVEVFLEHGADINATDKKKTSPVYYAAIRRKVEIVKLFVDKEADLNFDDNADTAQYVLFQSTVPRIAEARAIIIQHMIKLSALGRSMRQDVLALVRNGAEIERMCKDEAEEMRRVTVCDTSRVTLYDVLTGNYDDVAKCFRNIQFLQTVDRSDYSLRFPIYGEMLDRKILMYKSDAQLYNVSLQKLQAKLPLPYVCVELILRFFSNREKSQLVNGEYTV